MSIFLTGDFHGSEDIRRMTNLRFDASGLTRDDYLIQLGDFGLIWYQPNDTRIWAEASRYWLDWLESRPWTTLFIDGNHENHYLLANYPVEQWHGGKVHFIRDNVIHLMRGQVYDIDGKTFFAMGGADSIDRMMRTIGQSWWDTEVPSDAEYVEAFNNLEAVDNRVDYILTHECPANVSPYLQKYANGAMEHNMYRNWLDRNVAQAVDFEHWFFGHYHVDLYDIGFGGKYTCLMHDVYDLDAGTRSDRQSDDYPYPSIDDMPEPKFEHGYTIDEICDMTGASREDVERVIGFEMRGSTCMMAPDGQALFYRSDVYQRILPIL